MSTIKSPAELMKRKVEFLEKMSRKEKIRVRVHMGTSGQASGAKQIYDFIRMELDKRNIAAIVINTGDMGYSFAEPTIEVTLPGENPVVYGNVDKIKADEIIEKYIKNGEYVDGILPCNYQVIK